MKKTTSSEGLALIKAYEGLHLTEYKCPAGIWTIGYGHTGYDRQAMGKVITEAKAEQLLKKDLARFEERVNRLVKVELTQGQFDALVAFDFNTGALHTSTMLKHLNAGNYTAAANEFPKWSKAKVGGVLKVLNGLLKRRNAEQALFLGKSWAKP